MFGLAPSVPKIGACAAPPPAPGGAIGSVVRRWRFVLIGIVAIFLIVAVCRLSARMLLAAAVAETTAAANPAPASEGEALAR